MDLGPTLLFVLAPIVLLVLGFSAWRHAYDTNVAYLRSFAVRLDEGELTLDSGWLPTLARTSVNGELDGRTVNVSFGVRRLRRKRHHYTIYELEVFHAVPEFRVARARVEGLSGIVGAFAGDRDLQEKYTVSGGRGSSLRELSRSPSLIENVDELFAKSHVKSLQLVAGRLRATAGEAYVDTDSLTLAFERLRAIGRHCERRQLRVKALGEEPKLAVAGGPNHVECPCCHDDLSLDPAGLMACEGCDTVHHAKCYANAGGCAIYGCAQPRS